MKTPTKITSEIEESIILLRKQGIPEAVIAKAFNLSHSAVFTNTPSQIRKDIRDFQGSKKANHLHLLKLYAWLIADELECIAFVGTSSVLLLKPFLFSYLALYKWKQFIEGLIVYKNEIEKNRFAGDFPDGYKRLINALYPPLIVKASPQEIVEDVLKRMHAGEIPFPEKGEVNKPSKALAIYIKRFFPQNTDHRYFDSFFIPYIDRVIQEELSSHEQMYLKTRFGISENLEKEPWKKYGITPSTFRNMVTIAIKKLSSRMYKPGENIVSIMTDYKALKEEYDQLQNGGLAFTNKILKDRLFSIITLATNESPADSQLGREANKVLREMFPEEFENKDQVGMKMDLLFKILQTPITDLYLSVRAFNTLRDANIGNLHDLVQRKEEDLLKLSNFGRKTLAEVNEMLSERGLQLGMEL